MKRTLLLLLIFFSLVSQAQMYNNEWIDYSKTYYKFKVGTTGLYRIPQSLLNSAGLGSVNADHFQLWRNGKQIPIYTSVQNTTLGASDYIEFWGEMNDGKPDKDVYRLPDYQINDKYNLNTDTASYFLTVNTGGGNLHLAPTSNNVAANLLPAEPYFVHTAGTYYRDVLSVGRSEIIGTSYTYSSSFDYGEGFTSSGIAATGSINANYNNLNVYTGAGAPAPVFKINAVGNAVNTRYFKVTLNGDSIYGQTMDYYDYAKGSTVFDIAKLSSNNANIVVTNMGTGGSDRMLIAQIELTYPRQFDFGGASNFSFELPANGAGNFLQITGFNYGGTVPVLYDLTNGKRYDVDISNPALLKVALLPSAVDRKLIMVNEQAASIKSITAIEQRNFINYGLTANQGNFLIITNAVLTAASGPGDPVEDYRAYRSSAAGGSFTAKVYLMDQLTDQFAFGIKNNPLSIRNFVRWARNGYNNPVKDVLLIGKGVIYYYARVSESEPDLAKLNLVPTFGHPASDNLLTAEGSSSIPLTPIGRISAIRKDEVTSYLNKLKQYEALQKVSSPSAADNAWKKNVIHVTGAGDDATTTILQSALDGHKAIIQDTLYGAKVYSFTKQTSDAVTQISGGKLKSLFQEGISLLTYFGHSSATTLEFNLENPQNYEINGKYPVFIVMGCNAGNFYLYNVARFTTKETISERYVLADQRGSVAFLASTHLGIIHYLDIYNTRAYRAMSRTNYGGTLGEIMGETIRKVFELTTENDFYARFQCEQFTLHGDPAITLYNATKPDYVIEDPMVNIDPQFISVAETQFKVKAKFMNIGRAPDKSIVVEMKRTYPNQVTEVIQRDTIPTVHFEDSITYTLPVIATRDKGLNKITITVDADSQVDELYESNNTITKDVYIFEDEVRPVYPYNFSIINDLNPKLIASTANAFSERRDYAMEIDTTELFNSPLKVVRNTTSSGGTIEFNPGLTLIDSTVYYWRVSPIIPNVQSKWNTASFMYIQGTEVGFAQAHLYQHFKSERLRIVLDSASRKWNFGTNSNQIFSHNGVYPTTSGEGAFYSGSINDVKGYIAPGCSYDELIINVVDPVTMNAWQNNYSGPTGLYQSMLATCGPGRTYNFEYMLNSVAWRKKIMDFLDLVPDGSYVLIRSNTNPAQAGNTYAQTWKADEGTWGAGNSLYHRLLNQGFSGIDSFYFPRSWMFLYKKNHSADFAPLWSVSDGIYDGITINGDCPSPDTLGYVSSPTFGPAKAWHQLKWRGRTTDATAGDIPTIDVVGVNSAGGETILFNHLTTASQDFDLSSVSASAYPYLKLKMRNVDSINFTPYQLKYWMLTYDPVPEGAIAPNLYFTTKDVVEVGEPFNFGIAFKNISKVDFDSVKVKLTITDKNNVQNIVPVPKQKKLLTTAPNDTIKLNVPIDTRSLAGNNTLFIDFNPENDQPEQYLFNNYAFRNLYVKPDSLNPLLDVTFDGVHILNRDIVSSKPAILIKLKDEAKWMALDDTSLLNVQVKYPNGSTRQFYFGNNNSDTLQFIPAGQAPNTDNTASVRFNPYLFADGEYELMVTGKDRSENSAGSVKYRVIFKVINKPMISNMLNYPNPFTTSTAFVFTLTGSEVPQNIRIQVLTITGKVVREITKEELGPLHIGRNITEFKWDGTDQYGQKLANGIYLYRVITNLNGKSLDKYTSTDKNNPDDTDKYFNKGYGKMYLMR